RRISAFELAAELTRVTSGPAAAEWRLPRFHRRRTATAAIAALLAIAAISAWLLVHSGSESVADAPELQPVVRWPSLEWNSRLSPDAVWVSFLSDRGGPTGLWVKHLDGDEEAHSITTPPGELIGHTWSPDGRDIACGIVAADGNAVLYVVPALTPGAPRLTARVPYDGRWQPVAGVGSTIFLGQESARKVLAFDRQTSTFLDVTGRWPIKPGAVDVRSDGRAVVYEASAEGRTNLWTANVDGTGAVQLTADDFKSRAPIWAGLKAIVFASDRGGQTNLWRLEVPKGTPRQITSSAAAKIPEAASPDGSIVT